VALTGNREGYFHDHRGHAQEFISCVKRGFLFQGQYYDWQKQPRGTPVGTQPASAFVTFTQNHDQVGNTFYGERIDRLASTSRIRAMTGLLLLTPGTPMLFMGQEFNASTPFAFFADHKPELAAQVFEGRREFTRQFPSYSSDAALKQLLDPSLESTFIASKLDFSERESHAPIYRLHRDLLQLRRSDPVIRAQDRHRIEGAVLSEHAFVLRYFGENEDRLLVVNFGAELPLVSAPEPLLAPRRGESWSLTWSSDDPAYAGPGTINPLNDRGWRIPGESTCLLSSARL
jgi:maltooligosyltrehalose trehalohydrolase